MSQRRSAWRSFLFRYGVFLVVWLGVLLLSWFTFQRGKQLGGTAAWAGILHPVVFGLTAWPILRRFLRRQRWFTIPHAVLGLTYLSIGLGAVHFVFHYDSLSYAALRRPEVVLSALLVAIAGIVAYRIGAEGPWFRNVVQRLPSLPPTPRWSGAVRTGVFAAVAIAVASKLSLAATGSLGYVTASGGIVNSALWSVLGYLSRVGLLALVGAYYYWFTGAPLSRTDRVFLVAATGTLAGIGLLSGMKHEFLFVFFGVVIPYLWTRRPRRSGSSSRLKEAVFASGLVAAMLLLFAANPLYRHALNQLGASKSRIEQGSVAAGLVVDRLTLESSGGTLLTTGAENAWARLSIFPFHLAVVDQVPESQPFRSFDRYPVLPAMSFVPRFAWSEKPVNTSGSDFQRHFISTRVVNSTTPTVYGWSYMEAGLFGVLIVLMSLGLIAGFVERYLAERQFRSVAAVILYTALFVSLAEIEADPFWQLGGIPKLLAMAVLVYGLFTAPRLLRRHSKPAGRGVGNVQES